MRVHWDDRTLHVSLDLCHVLRTCWLTNVRFGEIEKSTITFTIVTLPHNEWSIFGYTHLLGAFVVCITLSSAPGRFEHCGIGRWLETSCRWSVVLRPRIWSYPGRDKFVCQWCLPSGSALYWWGLFFQNSPVVYSTHIIQQASRKLGYPLGLRIFIIINTCVMFAQYVIDCEETVANPALNAHVVCDVDVRSKRDECCACWQVSIWCGKVKWSTTKLKVTHSEYSKFQWTLHPEH